MRLIIPLVLAICTSMGSGSAQAGFIITVGSATSSTSSSGLSLAAGSTATLGLYIHNDLVGVNLSGQNFTLAFDLAAPGASNHLDGNSPAFQTMFTNFQFVMNTLLFPAGTASVTDPTGIDSSANPANGYDVLVDIDLGGSKDFNANQSITTATKIGDISFTLASNLLAGNYGFKFAKDALYSDDQTAANAWPLGTSIAAGADSTFYNQFNVSASVSAVPEPSSIAMLAVASGLVLGRHRILRRSRKTQRFVSV